MMQNGNGRNKKIQYYFKLYISGAAPNSSRAVQNIRRICERYFKGQHKLEIIDIYMKPEVAASRNIVAVPTLVKEYPRPWQIFIGTLSGIDRVANSILSTGLP